MTGERVRVDKWLWAVRAFKTRSAATNACASGKVLVGEDQAKPATKVAVGDVVQARRGDRLLIYRVRGLVHKRVGAKLVEQYVEDLSPPPTTRSHGQEVPPPGGARLRGQGRPTKKDRRVLEQLRGQPRHHSERD